MNRSRFGLFFRWFQIWISLIFLSACQAGTTPAPDMAPTVKTLMPVDTATPPSSPTRSATLTPRPILPPVPADWPERWLQGIPCHPPCWEGITPGLTTAAEAVKVLKANPLIATVELEVPALVPSLGYVDWTLFDGREGGDALYHAQTLTPTIYAIRPYLPARFKLGDVIQAYGEPSHVLAAAQHGLHINDPVFYSLQVIYRPLGFVLILRDKETKPSLDADLYFERVVFFDVTEETFNEMFPGIASHPTALRAWEGFQDFEFYCVDDVDGRFCQGE